MSAFNTPVVPRSRLLSARQLLATKVRFRWIIQGWLPRGSIALMIGRPHEGKSYLALDLAIAIAARGQRFLKRSVKTHGPVLIVSTQDRESRLRQRLLRLCRGRGLTTKQAATLPIYFHLPESAPDLQSPVEVEKMKRMIRSRRPVLVVLDLWTDFVGGKDENKSGVVGDSTAPLREMKNVLGCTFLAVCHTPKSQWNGGGAELTARGSGHLEGSADTKLTLKRRNGRRNGQRRCELGVWCRDSDVGEKPPRRLQLHVAEDDNGREDHRWRVVTGDGKRRGNRKSVMSEIVEHLRKFKTQHSRPPTTRQLREPFGNNPQGYNFKILLAELESNGLITSTAAGNAKLWDLV